MELHDPNTCPRCGNHESIREIGTRVTWQPMTLTRAADGTLTDDEYREFDYSDDPMVTGFDCSECMWEWATLAALDADIKERAALVAAVGRRADEDGRFAIDDADAFLAELLAATRYATASATEYEPPAEDAPEA